MTKNTELETLLLEREARDKFELEILTSYKNSTLIIIKSNFPGNNKNTFESHYVSLHFLKLVKSVFKIQKIFSRRSVEGLIFFIVTTEDAKTVKKKSIQLEDCEELGRFVDIDVKNIQKNFSRQDLNLPFRKCYLCEKKAVICVRNRTHPTKILCKFFSDHVKNFLFKKKNKTILLANLVLIAMLEELSREYSFGCVNANSSGSHHDMDFFLMLKGIEVVCDSIKSLDKKTIKNFSSLREHGKNFEKKLIEQCNGINTYKGAHFLILILSASVLQCNNFCCLHDFIVKFSKPCILDFPSNDNNTLENNHYTLGIRKEVLTGFKNHFEIFLPLLENGMSDLELTTKILEHTYDTTTIKRGGILELQKIQSMTKNAKSQNLQKEIHQYCIEKGLSTGGVADNFIITKMLFLLKNIWYKF